MIRLWIYVFVGFGLMFGSTYSQAQTADLTLVGTAGDYFASAPGSVSFSMGEPISETFASYHAVLLQGFQQPNLAVEPLSIAETPVKPELLVFPNPVSSVLNVRLPEVEAVDIQVSDMSGKNIIQFKPTTLSNEIVEIDMNTLVAGTYILTVRDATGTIWSYKVQKFGNR